MTLRKNQLTTLQHLVLDPVDWCGLLGVVMVDPDGWRRDAKDFEEKIGLKEFVQRAMESTVGSDEGSNDLYDAGFFIDNGGGY